MSSLRRTLAALLVVLAACARGSEVASDDPASEPEGEAGAAGEDAGAAGESAAGTSSAGQKATGGSAAGGSSGAGGTAASGGSGAGGEGGEAGHAMSAGGATGSGGTSSAGGATAGGAAGAAATGGATSAGGAGAGGGGGGAGGMAAGGTASGGTASGGMASGGAAGGGTTGPGACPAGQFITGRTAGGAWVCSPLGEATRNHINGNCAVYLGWRDGCAGCADAPEKWGRASGAACVNGAGADNVCIAPTAGPGPAQLFGLNTDGDVNNDDKLYLGLYCTPTSPLSSVGCPPGEFASDFAADGSPVCSDPRAVIQATINKECFLFGGWRDGCEGCSSPPAKWDRTSSVQCENLAGQTGDTCTQPVLGGEPITMLGLDFDGDVDGNDTTYVGFRCEGPAEASPPEGAQLCPPDHAAVGLNDGKLVCAPVGSVVDDYFRSKCFFYLGWQDSCGGCVNPPTKWGRTSVLACENGAGAEHSCATYTLGSESVTMFGLSPDGDVDDNDMLHMGFRCF